MVPAPPSGGTPTSAIVANSSWAFLPFSVAFFEPKVSSQER